MAVGQRTRRKGEMKNRSEYSPSNLLAQLEAKVVLDPEASDDERELASQKARAVEKALNRAWRARRRPSPGRSKFMRRVGLPVILFFFTCLSLKGVTCD